MSNSDETGTKVHTMVAEYDLQVCSDLERCKVMREIELVENVRVVSVREEFSLPNKISFLLRLP